MRKRSLFEKAINKISTIYFDNYDKKMDLKICGENLCEPVESVYRNDAEGVGYTGSYSTRYQTLDIVMQDVELTENDKFIDVGCGKGRVLSFLLGKNAKCSINGIEINEEAGSVAAKWTEKFDNVNVIIGNAFDINCDDFNIYFFGRPFLPKTFLEYIEKMERELTHPITLVYFSDQRTRNLMKNRKNWTKTKQGKIYKKNGFNLSWVPQGYSIWSYTPEVNE